MDEQLFVYEEDEQGYWQNHVLMAQEGQEPVNQGSLRALSWETPGAGRVSTSANELIRIAKKKGFTLRLIEKRERSREVPPEWRNYPLVVGATGNY